MKDLVPTYGCHAPPVASILRARYVQIPTGTVRQGDSTIEPISDLGAIEEELVFENTDEALLLVPVDVPTGRSREVSGEQQSVALKRKVSVLFVNEKVITKELVLNGPHNILRVMELPIRPLGLERLDLRRDGVEELTDSGDDSPEDMTSFTDWRNQVDAILENVRASLQTQ
ncbi:hypothetical protein R1flu_022694 [Riccia fluitans]|uniref:Uncharacterized protein n=1 Tax=Riccia fluitans TaxID=41844 RepID=A0ABD1XPX6_9MARC